MIVFIIGCVLAGLIVIAVPLLCIFLVKKEKKIQKLDWRFYAFMFALLAIGIASIVLIFVGRGLMSS